ncbi:MAG: AN1-type zinc finger protein [Methanoregula sp.]|nr:AN1-type zinc finger protein [Methanoregula sp.]
MGILASIVTFFSKFFGKEKPPVYENCSFCRERVYLPFHCEYCGRYFCGKHRLPCEHDCKNISEWKKTSASEGTTVESKAGSLFVRK